MCSMEQSPASSEKQQKKLKEGKMVMSFSAPKTTNEKSDGEWQVIWKVWKEESNISFTIRLPFWEFILKASKNQKSVQQE